MRRRFLERFEQRVRGADRHAIGFIDQYDLEAPDQWTIDDLLLEPADLFDLDLRIGQLLVRLDQHKVRMGGGLDLPAGPAEATGIRARALPRN